MASGHVNRIKRPNTWLHRPMLQNVKKALANPEPSTHGTLRQACLPSGCLLSGEDRKSSDPKVGAKSRCPQIMEAPCSTLECLIQRSTRNSFAPLEVPHDPLAFA